MHNLQDLEENDSSASNEKRLQKEQDELKKVESELKDATRRTATLQNLAAIPTFRQKRTTILTASDFSDPSEPSNRREAIYHKKESLENPDSARAPSEKSYDSESDIDLDEIEAAEKEEERLR